MSLTTHLSCTLFVLDSVRVGNYSGLQIKKILFLINVRSGENLNEVINPHKNEVEQIT